MMKPASKPSLYILLTAALVVSLTTDGVVQEREFHYYGEQHDDIWASFLNEDGTIAVCGSKDHLDERIWLMILRHWIKE